MMKSLLVVSLVLQTQVGFATVVAGPPPLTSYQSEIVEQFIHFTVRPNARQEEWENLRGRLRAAMVRKVNHQYTRASSYRFGLGRETIEQRVTDLADHLTVMLKNERGRLTEEERAEWAIDVLADLTAALAKASDRGRAFELSTLTGFTFVGGAYGHLASSNAYTFDNLLHAAGTGAAAGVAALAAILIFWRSPGPEVDHDLVERMAAVFWRRIGHSLNMVRGPSQHEDAYLDQVARFAHERMLVTDQSLIAGCEKFLSSNGPAGTVF